MRKYTRYVTAALLAASMVGLAIAQRQGGGGFGFGGGPATLINSKTVLADIKATDDQVAKLRDWAKDYQSKMFASFKDFKDLSKEERAERMAKTTDDAWKSVGEILKDEQVKRLKQIDLQVAGAQAYSRKEVAEALKISEDQRGKMQDAGMALFQEMRDLREEYGLKGFGGPKLDADKQKEYDKKMAAITKDFNTKLQTVLTDEQKAKWKEMTGEPIDVAKVQAESRPQFGGGRKKKDD